MKSIWNGESPQFEKSPTGNYRRLTQTAIIGNHHFFRK